MLKLTLFMMIFSFGTACTTTGERWQPTEGKLTKKKEKLFVQNKKSCFLRIQDAKLAGLDDGTSRLAYYHCMQAKGWTLLD